MPKTGKPIGVKTPRITVRLDTETTLYYRKRAKENGVTLSEFLRRLIVNGMLSDTAIQSEKNMYAMLREMREISEVNPQATLPDSLLLSIFFCEHILAEIMGGKSIQSVYDAQNKAKERLFKERGIDHDQSKKTNHAV